MSLFKQAKRLAMFDKLQDGLASWSTEQKLC